MVYLPQTIKQTIKQTLKMRLTNSLKSTLHDTHVSLDTILCLDETPWKDAPNNLEFKATTKPENLLQSTMW
jgi:hypothetical protein